MKISGMKLIKELEPVVPAGEAPNAYANVNM